MSKRWIRTLSLTALALLFLSAVASLAIIPAAAAGPWTDNYYIYTVEQDNATITGVDSKNPLSGRVELPEEINGHPVVAIGPSAFEDFNDITEIVIPFGVTVINSGAFRNCISLECVTISGNLKTIGSAAFSGCSALERIELPQSVTSIGDSAFENCASLRSLTLPQSAATAGKWAFSGCSDLEELIIRSNNTRLGDYIFFNGSENITLKCQNGSNAHKYAKSNNIKYELVKFNNDGSYTLDTAPDSLAGKTDVNSPSSPDQDSKGCSSSLGGTAAVLVASLAAALTLPQKKKK